MTITIDNTDVEILIDALETSAKSHEDYAAKLRVHIKMVREASKRNKIPELARRALNEHFWSLL